MTKPDSTKPAPRRGPERGPDHCKSGDWKPRWMICIACGGRIHEPDCTTRKTARDCRCQ